MVRSPCSQWRVSMIVSWQHQPVFYPFSRHALLEKIPIGEQIEGFSGACHCPIFPFSISKTTNFWQIFGGFGCGKFQVCSNFGTRICQNGHLGMIHPNLMVGWIDEELKRSRCRASVVRTPWVKFNIYLLCFCQLRLKYRNSQQYRKIVLLRFFPVFGSVSV